MKMKDEFVDIKINDNLYIENKDEIINYINGLENNINNYEWCISTYNFLKSKVDLKNRKEIIFVLKNKLSNDFKTNLDERGNINNQDGANYNDLLTENYADQNNIKNESNANKDNNSLIAMLPTSYEETPLYEENYLQIFEYIIEKNRMIKRIDAIDYTRLCSCLKSMIESIKDKGLDSKEYYYSQMFFKNFKGMYLNNSSKINKFIVEAYERFNLYSSELKHSKNNKHDNVRKISYPHALASSFIILVELSVIGYIVIKFMS